jgi:hypothetical protein
LIFNLTEKETDWREPEADGSNEIISPDFANPTARSGSEDRISQDQTQDRNTRPKHKIKTQDRNTRSKHKIETIFWQNFSQDRKST